METLYFTLGIASVVVAVVAVIAVWAMFKVGKVSAELKDLERSLHEGLSATHRDITMVDRTIQNGIDNDSRNLNMRLDSYDRNIQDMFQQVDRQIIGVDENAQRAINELYRYIDSRVDKLAAKQEKQQING